MELIVSAKKLLLAFSFFIIFASLHQLVSAATYYVDINNPGCSNSGPGTEAQPWCTLQRATSPLGTDIVAGDTVYVKNGTYFATYNCSVGNPTTAVGFRPVNSGTTAQPIAFRAYPGHTPVAERTVCHMNPSASFNNPSIGTNGQDYIIWDGFTVHNGNNIGVHGCTGCIIENNHVDKGPMAWDGTGDNNDAIRTEVSDNLIIRNNLLENIYVPGQLTFGNSACVKMYSTRSTRIHNNECRSATTGIGIKEAGDGNTVELNYIHDLWGPSIGNFNQNGGSRCSAWGCESRNNMVRNNIMANIDGPCFNINAPTDPPTHDNHFYSNTCSSVAEQGIGEAHAGRNDYPGFRFYNNILQVLSGNSNNRYVNCMNHVCTSTNQLINYNDLWGKNVQDSNAFIVNGAGEALSAWRTRGFDGNSLNADPQFVGPLNTPEGFKLQSTSPLRGAGRTGGVASGSPVDIGAYATGNECIGTGCPLGGTPVRCDQQGNYGGPCTVGVGACQRSGTYVCNNASSTSETPHCSATAGSPGTETCNGVDDDCDGVVDDGVSTTYYRDFDTDTYGNATNTQSACSLPSGYVTNSGDCNDNNANVNPGRTEVCNNGIDDNCNSLTDCSDSACSGNPSCTACTDNDADGYGIAGQNSACTFPNQNDCNDNNSSINPGATEVCSDNVDNDCDGQIDEGCGTAGANLVAYYIFEGNANDQSGNGNDGTINGGAGFTSGISGQGLRLDGVDDFVCLDRPGTCNGTNSNPTFDDAFSARSVSLWFNANSVNANQTIYEEGGATNGMNVYIGSGSVYGGVWAESNSWAGVWLSYPVSAGVWTHVTLVYNSSSNVEFYVNGTRVSSAASAASMPSHVFEDALGAMREETKLDTGDRFGHGLYYNGILDEVKVYNKSLTASEVQNIYNQDSGQQGQTCSQQGGFICDHTQKCDGSQLNASDVSSPNVCCSQACRNAPGDCTDDNTVNVFDLTFVGSRFGNRPGDVRWDVRADEVINNFIDVQDLDRVSANTGNNY